MTWRSWFVPLLTILAAACLSEHSTGPALGPVDPEADVTHAGPVQASSGCPACVLGPRVYTRSNAEPVTETATFPGDPQASYLIDIDDGGSQGADGSVILNGEVLLALRTATDVGPRHVRRTITLQAQNEIKVRLTGKPGSQLTVYILGGSAEVDASGGKVIAPGTGASITVPPGAFSGTVLLQITENSTFTAKYNPLAPTGHDLHVAPLNPTMVFQGPYILEIRLPVHPNLVPGMAVAVRSMIREFPIENMWATAEVEGALARIDMPVSGLDQMRTVFNANSAFVSLIPEKPADPPASPPASTVANALSAMSAPVSCALYPASLPGWPPPGALRKSPAGQADAPAAIVLVHGWDFNPEILTCADFAAKGQTGELRLAKLLAVIEEVFGSRAEIYVFTYPSFMAFGDNGMVLGGHMLSHGLPDNTVLIGHSMGGLVSRAAAQYVKASARPSLVGGIVTLGTPHLGETLAKILGFLKPYPSEGLVSLEKGIPSTSEEVPTHAFAGYLSDCSDSWQSWYQVLCFARLGYPSDGLVGVSTAAPFFMSSTPVLDGYDHAEMRAGESGNGDKFDPLFSWVINSVESMLPNTGAYNCAAQTQISVLECEALVALYNSTNGPGWTNNAGWLQTNTPCSWYGIVCLNGRIWKLDLRNNQLIGSIPAEIGGLNTLWALDLRGNGLAGPIPPALGDLTGLLHLILANNQLTGSIPPELGNLSNLIALDLQRNKLSSAVPAELGRLLQLQTVSLNANELSGQLPIEVAELGWRIQKVDYIYCWFGPYGNANLFIPDTPDYRAFDADGDGFICGLPLGNGLRIPAAPANVSPGSTSSPGPVVANNTVTMSWSASLGAGSYSLRVLNVTTGFEFSSSTWSSTSETFALSAGSEYRWSVAACNIAACSAEVTLYFRTPSTLPPVITGVSPNPVTGSSSPQPFTITGTGFVSGATVTLRDVTNNQTFPNRPISWFSSTEIVINPIFTTAAAVWTVQVINPGGIASNQWVFNVVAPTTTPMITGVSPNPVTGTNSAQPFTITGTGFVSGATVTLRDVTNNQVFPNRTISSLSSTHIVINPVFTTAPAVWTVQVINPGGVASNQWVFQVVAPAPVPD